MPWEIRKIDGKYCVYKENTSEKEGCHSSRADAVDQMRALYASEAEYAVNSFHIGDVDVDEAKYHLHLAVEVDDLDEVKGHVKEALAALGEHDEEDEGPEESDIIPDHDNPEHEEYAWEGPIVFENVLTGDNRVFVPGSIEWDADSLPWPFRWQKSSGQGHGGAVPVGRVDKLERREDGSIYGYGVIIPSLNEEAAEYLRLVQAKAAGGVSVDGDSAQFEVAESENGTPQIQFHSMRLRSLTAVDIPAFKDAHISLTASGLLSLEIVTEEAPEVEAEVELAPQPAQSVYELREELAKKKKKRKKHWDYGAEVLVASAIPVLPSTDAFEEPKFDGPTALTVTKDGKVFGHLALFDTCHIGFPGTCVSPPKGSSYRYFHTGEIETAEGDLVQVGHLTFNTGHAGMNASPKDAASHYDHTGTVAADVRAGEDQYGIWVAGALRPSLSDEDIRVFRSAPLSGDWRRISGKLELVGALAVNVPGFPVPRVRAMVASGETTALFTFEEEVEISEYEFELRQGKKQEIMNRLGGIVEFHPGHSDQSVHGRGGGGGSDSGPLRAKSAGEKKKSKASLSLKTDPKKLNNADLLKFHNKARNSSIRWGIATAGAGYLTHKANSPARGGRGGIISPATVLTGGATAVRLGQLSAAKDEIRLRGLKLSSEDLFLLSFAFAEFAAASEDEIRKIIGDPEKLTLDDVRKAVSAISEILGDPDEDLTDSETSGLENLQTELKKALSTELSDLNEIVHVIQPEDDMSDYGLRLRLEKRAELARKALPSEVFNQIYNEYGETFAATKTEDGKSFPASDYAYVPDAEKPSTWKLRLTAVPDGDPDPRIVGAAVAALGPGFRGNKVEIPEADLPKVKAKVKAAWLKANPDKTEANLPPVLK